ncbi:unnamed protein product [Medioppia subpectinata]|uniref:Glycosyltransferase n=1 Tax=Medioppia subpectinata TaxID=1979941 RepID=A0A7R9KGL0_9ACAR|nr:unnamed protein product [Medioppia subpectinata]CAG2103018.1 unnamed protein product [Medioppia subpectinata]
MKIKLYKNIRVKVAVHPRQQPITDRQKYLFVQYPIFRTISTEYYLQYNRYITISLPKPYKTQCYDYRLMGYKSHTHCIAECRIQGFARKHPNILPAHKNARFLPQYYETYRKYYPSGWYHNAGERPVYEVINKQPHIIHRMDGQFGCRPSICPYLYTEANNDWKNSGYYSIHLLIRGDELSFVGWCLGGKTPAVYRFNETIVESLSNTFALMIKTGLLHWRIKVNKMIAKTESILSELKAKPRHEIHFAHFISILSVLKNQRPDRIYIHCDCHELRGDRWRRVVAIARLTGTELTVRTIDRPTEVFGHKLSAKNNLWHAADVTRIQVLREFGGVYLDRDVYVIKSFNPFYKYEMTVDFENENLLCNQILIAHKNARFLSQYYETYREYNPSKWYYNAGERPVFEVINKQPHIIHRMDGQFGCRPSICPYLYTEANKDWKTSGYYSIHFLIRGDELSFVGWCLGGKTPAVYRFNETIVESLSNTIYIHCDCRELRGDRWRRVVAIARLTGTELTVRTIDRPTEVFGHKLSAKNNLWHAADVTRIQVLREFGGVYLDRDVYVIKSFNPFYKYEMTIDFENEKLLCNQILIAHKNARFLSQYYETYREYNPSEWYYNAGERPVLEVINKQPHLIHRMDGQFGCRPSICPYLYTEANDWKTSGYYSIHFLIRGDELSAINWCLDRKTPAVYRFNETIVESLSNTFGSMARDVLHFELQLLNNV